MTAVSGVAEHERAKEPLPTRYPRPHPQGVVLDAAYFEAAFARCSQRWSAGRCWRQYAAN